MWMVQDYMIHKFLRECDGKATKQEDLEALGSNEDRLMIMQRMGIVVIDGDIVKRETI